MSRNSTFPLWVLSGLLVTTVSMQVSDSRQAKFVKQGRTIVMVTHDPAAAQRAARRLQLRDGQLVQSEEGTVHRAA